MEGPKTEPNMLKEARMFGNLHIDLYFGFHARKERFETHLQHSEELPRLLELDKCYYTILHLRLGVFQSTLGVTMSSCRF